MYARDEPEGHWMFTSQKRGDQSSRQEVNQPEHWTSALPEHVTGIFVKPVTETTTLQNHKRT